MSSDFATELRDWNVTESEIMYLLIDIRDDIVAELSLINSLRETKVSICANKSLIGYFKVNSSENGWLKWIIDW